MKSCKAILPLLFCCVLHACVIGATEEGVPITREQHTLVTRGPYRWIRHPFYDSAALLMMAVSLIAANWFLLLTGGLAFVLLVVRTQTEEEKLLARFGEAYRAYMKRTGRFLPRTRANRPGA